MKFFSSLSSLSVKYLLSNYFLFTAIGGFAYMLGLPFGKFDLLLIVFAIYVSFFYLLANADFLDKFILSFLVSIALVGLSIYYLSDLYFAGVRYQLLLTIFFFVGRSRYLSDWSLFEKAKIVVYIVSFIGLILFVVQPGWYVSWKLSGFQDASDGRILEMTRLSAFWTYPYWISYGCAIIYYYLLYRMSVGNSNKKDAVGMMYLFLIIILTQQRMPLIFVSFATVIYFVNSFFYKDEKTKRFRNIMFLYLLMVVCAIFIMFSIIDADRIFFILEKMEAVAGDKSGSFLSQRANLYYDFLVKPISTFGDGIGRYSHRAYSIGKKAITDHQYLCIVYETGVYGCIGYLIILLNVLLKGFKNLKYNVFELGIIVFFLIAMSGANSLSSQDQHTAIFWICCGRIFNEKCLIFKKRECSSL